MPSTDARSCRCRTAKEHRDRCGNKPRLRVRTEPFVRNVEDYVVARVDSERRRRGRGRF